MVTFILILAVITGFAVLLSNGAEHIGSSNIIDRDAQRLELDLSALHNPKLLS